MQRLHAAPVLRAGTPSSCWCKRKLKIKVADKLQCHEGPGAKFTHHWESHLGVEKHAQGFKMMERPGIKKLPDLSAMQCRVSNYAKTSLIIWLLIGEMIDGFEVERGFEKYWPGSYICRWLGYDLVLSCIADTAIICKFESKAHKTQSVPALHSLTS